MSFFPVFGGGGAVYPAQQTLVEIALTADTTLRWPLEQQVGGANIAAAIVDVVATAGPHTISLADATLVSNGYAILFHNLGANDFGVEDVSGNTLLTVASGEAWVIYLRDNSTEDGEWEIFQQGAGASSANAAALAGAGLKAILTTLNQRWEVSSHVANYPLVDGDRATLQVWTGGVGTFTLPDPATVGADWFCALKNAGSGLLTVNTAAGTIDGASSVSLAGQDSTFVASDGAAWFTVGLGQEINSIFDFVSIDVNGTGDYTLSGAELNRVAYEFTGLLTGNRNIIVPAAIQQYWVYNNTTGAFNLEVKTAAGTGVVVPAGTRIILYCDGVNVVNAQTNTASLPAVVQGDLLYGSAPGILSALAKNTTAQRVITNGGTNNNPMWDQVNLLLGVLGYRAVNKSATTARATTIVSAADPALFLNDLAVGIWDVEIQVLIGGGGGGFRFQLSQTGTMTGTISPVGYINGAASILEAAGCNIDTTYAALSGSNTEWLSIKARIAVTVQGNLSFSWAQNSSNATPTSVFLGTMVARRVA